MLSPYRVLDLSDERGQFAGLVLAQLGADVIIVEPPSGSATRRRAPLAGDVSLVWTAWNRGKRSIVLDRDEPAQRQLFSRLVASADVLIESERPGQRDKEGLAYEDLAGLNPGLVHVSITPFGSDGPKANWAATDLTVWASAGPLALTGDHDRAPLRVPGGQAFLHAAGDAVAGAIAALYERASSGLGQHVTISAQQSSTVATQAQILNHAYGEPLTQRHAGGSTWGQIVNRYVYPALDGHVTVTLGFGSVIGPFTSRLMAWIYEEGHCDEATLETDWIGFGARLQLGGTALDVHSRTKEIVARFTATKTKAELFTTALTRKLLIAPVATIADVLRSEHLEARHYWHDLSGARCPGQWAHVAPIELRRLGPAPALGQHTAAVLTELDAAEHHPPTRSVPRPRPLAPTRPLDGIRVLDFSWSMAGPIAVRVLADFGATVVRVESGRHADMARTLRPFDRRTEPPVSAACADFNAGKLDVSLNMGSAAGREVGMDLVRWADVVIESFSPGTMADWGFDAGRLRQIKPSIVMLSSSLMGQTGPLAGYAAFGNTGASLCGFTHLTGWPDRDPAGPYSAYTDYVSPRLAVAAILAALDHRRRTGQGSAIDLSQTEAGVVFLSPAVLASSMGGHPWEPMGNADHDAAPHGVYPSAGSDEWVAIACQSDDHWTALADLIGRTDLAALATEDRHRVSDEIDRAIQAWTSRLTGDEVETSCQARDVPAHRVQNSAECLADPQLAQRRHFRPVPHSVVGQMVVQGPRAELSRTPADVSWAGPDLGEHTWYVLTDVLGYEADRIARLYASGALD